MKNAVFILLFLLTGFQFATAHIKIQNLLTENRVNPVGIDIANPRFTWQLASEKRNVCQTAYEVTVKLNKNVVWESGKVQSDQSVHVAYAGVPLKSGEKYTWQVRVWDNSGKVTPMSEAAFFQTAFLNVSDWKARWIEPGYNEDDRLRPSPLMRKQFSLSKKVLSATAYITAHGLYEAFINGQRIGDAWLTPGWTSYKKRLQYQVYDVTALIKPDNNAIGVMLGNGWYRGVLGYLNTNIYGNDIALLCQIEIVHTDGTKENIITDESWTSSTGSICYSEIYNGEITDARLDKTGWTSAGYNDSDWYRVKIAAHPMNVLLATINEPVKKHERFKPVKFIKTPKGEQVIDFGQNLVGVVQMKVSGKSGDKIVLSYAEVIDKEGNFYTNNLRTAKAQDTYILKGGGEEIFEPHFTWHGFRYIKIEGYPGELKLENFTAVAMYSDIKPTGCFTTSNNLINQLQHNIQWGQKGNFLDVPTDCPQRDERLGWTGDAQVFSRTAAYNMNVNNFFAKWLKDIEADQIDGAVPYVVPNVRDPRDLNSAGWSDVATIIPWNMYLVYGDKRLLELQYNSMKAYVESIRRVAKNDLWNSGFHYGDWLFYSPDDDKDGRAAVTNKYLIAQCFYAQSTFLLIKAAEVMGFKEDATFYRMLLSKIKEAFMDEYVTPNGSLVSGTQTAYVLALNFDMLPKELREQASARLVNNIKSYGNHLTTGFLGTPYLCHVLTRFGYSDIAYQLLLQETYPSWLYPVKMGATTIWERWDGVKLDSTFQTSEMNSFNHYAYGAIGDWMYRTMAGLDTYEDGVGYKHIKIKPYINEAFKSVSASLNTYYGKISSQWEIDGDKLTMNVEIPVNTTGTVFIPVTKIEGILEGGKALSGVKEIHIVGSESGYVILEMGSGRYQFVSRKD